MINLRFNSQELTPEEFKSLSSKEKHDYTEQKMGNRIMLPYNLAVNLCRSLIDSDEKLSRAFQNFLEWKNFNGLDGFDEVLTGVFLDKFKERIFFLIHENRYKMSEYIYDIPSGKFFLFVNNGKPMNDLPSDLLNIESSFFMRSVQEAFEKTWRTARLTHVIVNESASNDNLSINQEYVNDNHYRSIFKIFRPLNNVNEINNFDDNLMFCSSENPAHATIDPDDLINHQVKPIKNARNI